MTRLIVRIIFTVILISSFIRGIRQKDSNYEEFCPWMVLSALSIGLTFIPVDGFLCLVSCVILIVNAVQFVKELQNKNVEAGYCLHIIFASACIALWIMKEIVVLRRLLTLYCVSYVLYNIYIRYGCARKKEMLNC